MDRIVSGGGTSHVNATYTESGTINGKVNCVNSTVASDTIEWDGSQWRMIQTGPPPFSLVTVLYTNPGTGSTPPLTGWVTSSGTAPAPTVTLSGGGGTAQGNMFLVF